MNEREKELLKRMDDFILKMEKMLKRLDTLTLESKKTKELTKKMLEQVNVN